MNPSEHPLFERQLALELEMASRGVSQEQSRVANAKASGRESNTSYGSYLVNSRPKV